MYLKNIYRFLFPENYKNKNMRYFRKKLNETQNKRGMKRKFAENFVF